MVCTQCPTHTHHPLHAVLTRWLGLSQKPTKAHISCMHDGTVPLLPHPYQGAHPHIHNDIMVLDAPWPAASTCIHSARRCPVQSPGSFTSAREHEGFKPHYIYLLPRTQQHVCHAECRVVSAYTCGRAHAITYTSELCAIRNPTLTPMEAAPPHM